MSGMWQNLKNRVGYWITHQGFIRYFKNTSWLFVEKIFRLIVGIFVWIWVARYLGPQQYGLFSYVQSFVALFAVISTLGLDGIVVRELVKYPKKQDELLGSAFLLKLIGAFLTLILLVIAVNLTSNDKFTNSLIFIIGSATIFQAFNVIDFYFQAKVLSKYVVYAKIITLSISSVIKVVLIIKQAPLITFVWVLFFDALLLALALIYFFSSLSYKIRNWKINKVQVVSLLSFSYPLIFSGIAFSVQSYIDQVMLKEMIGLKEVGYYSIAFQLIALFGFVSTIPRISLFPVIIESKGKSVRLYEKRLINFYRLMMILFLFTSFPIYFFGKFFVILLYGESYSQAGFLFSIFGFRLFFAFFGMGRGSFLLAENRQKHDFFTLLFGAIINIVLNYFLIPIYGVFGAIIATYISFTFSIFLLDIFVKSTRRNIYMMISAIFSFWKVTIRS